MKFGFIALLPLLLLVGCETESDIFYLPHPALVNVPATQPAQQPPAQVLATVLGVRNADPAHHIPLSIETRLRIENVGSQPITFDPAQMQLTTADLVQFPPPLVYPDSSFTIPPGLSTVVTANFPFPAGTTYESYDLSTIHLRWNIRIGERDIPLSRDFQSAVRPSYGYDPNLPGYPYLDDEPDPPYPYVGGPVIIHRNW